MAGTKQGIAVLLALVMSCIFLQAAADSTIQNAALAPILVNGLLLFSGQVVTIPIEIGKSTASVDLVHARNASAIKIRNSREYFVIVNESGGTGVVFGRVVRTLDLVEGRERIESSF